MDKNSLDELVKRRSAFYSAMQAEDEEKMDRILSTIEIRPYIAQAAKAAFGKAGISALKSFNLDAVEHEYGKGWINE